MFRLMILFYLSLIIYGCAIASDDTGNEKTNLNLCDVKGSEAGAAEIVFTLTPYQKKDLYLIEFKVPKIVDDQELKSIQFSSRSSSVLFIDLPFLDEPAVGYFKSGDYSSNANNPNGRKYMYSLLWAEASWLNGEYCIRANYSGHTFDANGVIKSRVVTTVIKN